MKKHLIFAALMISASSVFAAGAPADETGKGADKGAEKTFCAKTQEFFLGSNWRKAGTAAAVVAVAGAAYFRNEIKGFFSGKEAEEAN